jgi:hypothetical protein
MLKRAALPLTPQRAETEQAQSRAIWELIVPVALLTSTNATKLRRSLSLARREKIPTRFPTLDTYRQVRRT